MIIVNDQNDADDDDNDGNGGHVDHNDGNGGHEDDNDGTGGQDDHNKGEAVGKTDELDALLTDLTGGGHRGTEADQGEGGGIGRAHV